MGAEREDIDPAAKGGTEPGVGPKAPAGFTTKPGVAPPPPPPRRPANGTSSAPIPAAPPAPAEEPAPVDFDALHAALGEGLREAPHPPVPPPPVKVAIGESQGRSNATYASTRPHAVPAPHVAADLGAPPVIVAEDDTVPGGPPQMTAPLTTPMAPAMGHPSSGPYAAAPHVSSSPMAAANPLSPSTPPSFAVQGLPPTRPGQVQLTMRMPERPRRPRTPTVVVRPRGPSMMQKLVVFAVMLLLVSACGIGIVMWRAPQLFGLGPKPVATQAPPPRFVPPPPQVATTVTTGATATAVTTIAPAPTVTASGAAAAKPKAAKPAAPR